MVEADLHIARLLQSIGNGAGLVVTRKAVRQMAFTDHPLMPLEAWHMRVAEHREAGGRKRERTPHRVQAGCDGLVRQAVDQVEIESLDPGPPEHVDDGSGLLITLHPVDR